MKFIKLLFTRNEWFRELVYIFKPFFDDCINPSSTLFQIFMAIPFLRIIILRMKIGQVGSNLKFKFPIYIQNGKNINIGNNATFGPGVHLIAGRNTRIVIGNNLTCGPYVMIAGRAHGIRKGSPMKYQPCIEEDIIIGNDVLLGVHSVVLEKTKLADGSILAANSVAGPSLSNKTDQILIGLPAKPVLKRR